jgi:threonine dehydrogenase-like Zn-dependent dehydrogenase
VPELQAYPIDKSLAPVVAAFSEPLSCCLHGMDVINIQPGERVLIVGGGAIGLLMLQLVKNAGALTTGLIEPEPFKRELGKQLGADFVLSPSDTRISEIVADETNGGPDVIIECAGSKTALSLCFQESKTGTRILLFGLAPKGDDISLNLQKFFKKELVLKSSLLNPYTFQRAIDLLTSGKVNTSIFPVNTMHLSLDDFMPVFSGTSLVSSIKNIIVPFH